jgi:hypothetical protein
MIDQLGGEERLKEIDEQLSRFADIERRLKGLASEQP